MNCGISFSRFTKIANAYNLKRDKNQTNKLRIKHAKTTLINQFGEDNTMKIQIYKDKWQKTVNNRTSEQIQKIVQKQKQTKLEKYNNKNYHNVEQMQKTVQERYGVNSGFNTEFARQRHREVSLEKYGVDNPFKSKEVRELGKKALQEKYGVNSVFKLKTIRLKSEKTNIKLYGNKNAFKNINIQNKQSRTIQERYGVQYGCQTPNCVNASPKVKSQPNLKFYAFIQPDMTEFPLDKYRYDFVKNNYLIEINPTFTHNSYKNPFGKPTPKNYHLDKSVTALNAGYACIHIFDWDNWEKIKYLVQDKKSLYARTLKMKEIPKKELDLFLNNYHLQNTCQGQIVRLGLYNRDELVQVMTFGKPRYNKNYEWELLRLCTKAEYKVIGGAEKLFKYFVKNYNPESIISYCDFSKFTGKIYTKLGFIQISKSKPSKHWSKGHGHITDNLLRQRGYDQLFKANYGKGTSNEQLMLEHGWLPVYDCGQGVYIWKANDKVK